MNSPLKQSIIQGLEVVGAVALATALQYLSNNVLPMVSEQYPYVAMVATPVIVAILKWLRANPNIPVNDYVRGK